MTQKNIRVSDIISIINDIAPFELQEEWDNSGFLVGDRNCEVKKIGFCLDLTVESLNSAVAQGVDLVITHHPVIFGAKKAFLADDVAFLAARSGINVISAHTCFDAADGGINDVLCEILGISDAKRVADEGEGAIARFGSVNEMTPRELASLAAEKFNTAVSFVDASKSITSVAVLGGSGGSLIGDVIKCGIDALVTGEAKHHELLMAQQAGVTLVVAGHFETENIAMPVLMKKVSEKCEGIEAVLLTQTNPLKYICPKG